MRIGFAPAFWRLAATLLLLASNVSWLPAATSPSDADLARIDFGQKLGAQVDLGLAFVEESGRNARLGDFFGKKPVILVLGYYQCPMLCTLVVNGMVETLHEIQWSIGDQFEVINVSIDPKEGPGLAAAKKRSYLKAYRRPGAKFGWHFLTGKEPEIQTLANAVGFKYVFDPVSGQYAHPSGLVVLSPKGKVIGYQFGVAYRPADLLATLRQARTEYPRSPVQRLVLLCFHYNPIQGKYGPAIMIAIRLMALATLVSLAVTVVVLARRPEAAPDKAEVHATQTGGPAP